jgi:uncharacterized protein YkwD
MSARTSEGWLAGGWQKAAPWFATAAAAFALAACGGGGGDSPQLASPPPAPVADPAAPPATGNTATDAFNRMNFRRAQAGLAALGRNARIDAAAQAHSDYQAIHNEISHIETPGLPGFTGVQPGDRLNAAGYRLPANDYAYGEVIAARSNAQGAAMAEDLLAAIYHRFAILEPMYKEAGVGAATGSASSTYLTADMAAIGLDRGLPGASVAVYPFAGQENVPADFASDSETPDPVPEANNVGYPISVHANLTSTLLVQSFTVKPRGGQALPVRLLTRAGDGNTPPSGAAIIPLSPMAGATTYDVQFTGTLDGAPVSRAWSFKTL